MLITRNETAALHGRAPFQAQSAIQFWVGSYESPASQAHVEYILAQGNGTELGCPCMPSISETEPSHPAYD